MNRNSKALNIRDEIVATRKKRIQKEGHTQGLTVPVTRQHQQVPFGVSPFLICEVKRRSPSKGDLAPGINAVEQAAQYVAQGVTHISVLTETDYFAGSLQDLIDIKGAFPKVAVLRKDFLFDEEDIYISYRAGADAVLLIAAILDEDRLRLLYSLAQKLSMAVLLEVHDEADCQKVENLQPAITGINSRNLATFILDPIIPLALKTHINWPTKLVFESGIKSLEQGLFARQSGFEGLLVGESVLKKPELIKELLSLYPMKEQPVNKLTLEEQRAGKYKPSPGRTEPSSPAGTLGQNTFWEKLYERKKPQRPLVKICGLTNRNDAELCAALGADLLGFVFASSKRQATPELLYELKDVNTLKVAVVVTTQEERAGQGLSEPVHRLLEEGLIDAVQFHGEEKPAECFSLAYPYYKALRLKTTEDAARISRYFCPRVLIDTFSEQSYGGTGQSLSAPLIEAAQKQGPLWLAGGISPDNVKEIIELYKPELIDVSSRLEQSPGKKDPAKLKRFFQQLS